ncbi:MAG TPA: prolyl oligopeptidase family serine peptidase [Azospirillaceae bacterium]|nr:prolyl oligopeptidase family serine peptidase [Azospirillaceae bacterium]
MRRTIASGLIACSLAGAALPAQAADPAKDEFLWLEEVEGQKALDWVRARNAESEKRLKGDARYEALRAEAERILTARDRIPYGTLANGKVDNFWQDEKSVRGVWRRADLASYRTDAPAWETVLDVDALAAAEKENWVFKGKTCLAPENTRCLVQLSRGGKDAVEIREYDVASRKFVEGGFTLPEAKQSVAWADKDTVLVASDFGPDSMTSSGYPRQVRLWKRGTAVAQAKLLFEGAKEDVASSPVAEIRPEGTELFVNRSKDFFSTELHHVAKDGKVTRLDLPSDIDYRGMIGGKLLLILRSDWTPGGTALPKGSLVAVDLKEALSGAPKSAETIVAPTERSAVQDIAVGRDKVLVSLLDNVQGKVVEMTPGAKGWTRREVALPAAGTLAITAADDWGDAAMVRFTSYLQPDTLYLLDGKAAPAAIKSLPARFDAAPYVTEQRMARSKDGTDIPYFIVHRKDMKADGANPTLLYGYGGFEVAMTPSYLSPLPKAWIEKGGVYVVANIRGGGEFGPRWHQAALKENRQKAFDDFIAVSEHLVSTKVTSPAKLGIYGGSNGGLLVGAMLTQRPELFGAVVCAVPLLDMMRYHTLLAGASWMGEYGNPDVAAERAYIEKYSPYQNVKADRTYPEVFFHTSTKDDRVHPGHARKMAARMTAMGKPVIYFENIEGGHSAAANLKQRAELAAMQTVYLLQKLADPAASQ